MHRDGANLDKRVLAMIMVTVSNLVAKGTGSGAHEVGVVAVGVVIIEVSPSLHSSIG